MTARGRGSGAIIIISRVPQHGHQHHHHHQTQGEICCLRFSFFKIQYRYLVFDPPGLGTRPGYTLWFGLAWGVKDQISIL